MGIKSTSTTSSSSSSSSSVRASFPVEEQHKTGPFKYQNLFERNEKRDLTPAIGTEFLKGSINLRNIIQAANADELLLDLAVYVSQRGVLFFRDQDITPEEHLFLVSKLSSLTRQQEAVFHVHPMTTRTKYGDNFVRIFSDLNDVYKGGKRERTQRGTGTWHTDLSYEKRPADYSALQIKQVPADGGGDTLWASGYAAYEKLTPVLAEFFEKLTIHSDWTSNLLQFNDASGEQYKTERGLENVGRKVTSDHALVRTNPVTGWRSLYFSIIHNKYVNELNIDESDALLEFLARHLTENHDIQVRIRWEENDVAIWDNRSTFHTGTFDYGGFREGYRVTTLGEVPFFEKESKTRSESLKNDFKNISSIKK
ncbi:uncharacterized protein PRCAT00002507001 [Priceomyces carsonii]|uniref:uncharacterized protein n=1 Tax=Priceomyces carsonii TaxID=28549 RepID=UPI002ED7DB8A|nr:unnamed protein product [Priceomyces carsonii]